MWGLHNTGQEHSIEGGGTDYGIEDADIDAPEAWDIHTDASNVIVAVIDTGVDYTHPDLAANMWINQAEYVNGYGDPNDESGDGYPGIAGVDDDGDGLIDEDSQDNSRFLQDGVTPNPNYTNDIPGDDDENGYVDDIYGYDFEDFIGSFV